MFRAFSDSLLHEYLSELVSAMGSEIRAEPENKLLNLDQTQYVDYLVDRYTVEPLSVYWEEIQVSRTERDIPAERFPSFRFNVEEGRSYPKSVFQFSIPFTGQTKLWRMRPSSWAMSSQFIDVTKATVRFDIINFYDDKDAITREKDSVVEALKGNIGTVAKDIKAHNAALPELAERAVTARREKLLEQNDLLHSLGVSVAKSGDVPETFAVDTPKRRVTIKPQAPESTYQPEPALDGGTYTDILKIIQDVGVSIERLPSLYQGKDEEALRDHLLMVLGTNYPSASGETFNRKGKTDILLRHENSNVFVAECAKWAGPKAYLKKISQALSYLTWRDSKAAMVIFIANKQLQPVLDKIVETTPEHPCWTHTQTTENEGWFQYRFHLPDDETRGVQFAVMAFHVPNIT